MRTNNLITLKCGIIILGFPTFTYASYIDNETQKVDFNPIFLNDVTTDLTSFNNNVVIPGKYNVDVYVNGEWKYKDLIEFRKNNNTVTNCFLENDLLKFKVKEDILKEKVSELSSQQCMLINEWVDDATSDFNLSSLRLDISIPQIALNKDDHNIDSSLWDRGINGGFISHNTFISSTNYKSSSLSNETNAFSSIQAGLNFLGWQFRHNGQLTYNSISDEVQYQSASTYAERAFPELGGTMSIGKSSTIGSIFDSFGFIGLNLSSDQRMIPDKISGYAPVIRGFANSNARVEIRQQGTIIYQTNVAGGNFEIDDLPATGYRGNLDVSIIESDGRIQSFVVPFSSVIEMLRPGQSRYSLSFGAFDEEFLVDKKPLFLQGTYRRGLNNYLTGYSGLQIAEDYQSLGFGTAIATTIGSFSLDLTHSNAKFNNIKSETGQSYRLSYNKAFIPTSTNITLAAYRYSTSSFYTLRDALAYNQYIDNGYSGFLNQKQRSEFQLSLNQKLPNNWGRFNVIGSWSDFWEGSESQKSYQISYNKSFKNFSVGVSATKHLIENKLNNERRDDIQYLLSLSAPFKLRKHSLNVNSTVSKNNEFIILNGYNGNNINYNLVASHSNNQDVSLSGGVNYQTNYTTIGGNYSQNESSEQFGLNITGSIIGHKNGIHFSAAQPDTMVIVHAPKATGATITNTPGLHINKSGYAIVPTITPYRDNKITLDPVGASLDVEFAENTKSIIPYPGSISKVTFDTKSGKVIFMKSFTKDGNILPFGASVSNDENTVIGMVGQGGILYFRTNDIVGNLNVKWGQESDQQCEINYDLSKIEDTKKVINIEGVCK